jgi:hypothetical protein
MSISRREVLHRFGTVTSPILLGRSEAQVTSDLVRFRPEIEPLVSIIERTPRERCAEAVVDQLRRGVSYRQLMAALFLAGVRNINPQPPGFALHCVFVIHSSHLISLEAPPDSRMLPLFYALDNFKSAQERDMRGPSGDYTMRAIHGTLPRPDHAAALCTKAMDAWDQEKAERAIVALARHRSGGEAFELLWKYGARDYRNIGHKAIYVANACRTLHAIGWQHAEPVLRSLVLSLLAFGREQQVNGYRLDDQCYESNLKTVRELFPRLDSSWVAETADAGATRGMLELIRKAAPSQACADVSTRLAQGKAAAGSVWDAVHLAAAELRMRLRSGAIVGIHAVTSANALHYAYLASTTSENRLLMLLQAVGWMAQFRKAAEMREQGLRHYSIADLEPGAGADSPEKALAEIFAGIPSQLDDSAGRVVRLAGNPAERQAFVTRALRYTVSKADEVHYYKYLAALVEDVPLVNTQWQPHLLAAMVYYLKGSDDPDSAAIKQAREALRSLPS